MQQTGMQLGGAPRASPSRAEIHDVVLWLFSQTSFKATELQAAAVHRMMKNFTVYYYYKLHLQTVFTRLPGAKRFWIISVQSAIRIKFITAPTVISASHLA